jgi:hypothetical protein
MQLGRGQRVEKNGTLVQTVSGLVTGYQEMTLNPGVQETKSIETTRLRAVGERQSQETV